MVRVYSTPNTPVAHLVRHALEAEGIDAEVRGETRAAFVGEIPPIECWVEVWVPDDDALASAEAVRGFIDDGPDAKPWTCPSCGETVEGQFGVCWSCGEPAPGPIEAA